MSRLTRDGTAEPVSRHQILRCEPGQGNVIFPVQLTTSRIFANFLLYPWENQCEWHRMIRMTEPDCAVMCNFINIRTYIIYTKSYIYRRYFQHAHFIPTVGVIKRGVY